MTVIGDLNKVQYAGNGATTVFAFNNNLYTTGAIKVIETVDSTGVDTLQVITTDYTVTLAGDFATASITMVVAPASGVTLTLVRDEPDTQTLDYVEGGAFPSAASEIALDKETLQSQTQAEQLKRCLKLPATSQTTGSNPFDGEMAKPSAGSQYMQYNDTTKVFDMVNPVNDQTAVGTLSINDEILVADVDDSNLLKKATIADIILAQTSSSVIGPGVAVTDNALTRWDGTSAQQIQGSSVTLDDSDNISGLNEATITNGSNDAMPVYQTVSNFGNSGLAKGGILSLGTASTEFSISDGFGYAIDSYTDAGDPVFKKVVWTGLDDITVTVFPTELVTRVYIDAGGAVQQTGVSFTADQIRKFVTIGAVLTADGVNATGIASNTVNANDVLPSLQELGNAIGNVNITGNQYTAASTDLTIAKSAGDTFGFSLNAELDNTNPNRKTSSSDAGVTFFYAYRSASGSIVIIPSQTDIDPDQWDDASGTLQAVPNNKWTIQRCFFFPSSGISVIQFGQTIYDNESEAIAAITQEAFVIIDPVSGSRGRSSIAIKKGETDLSSSSVTIQNTGKFGYESGGAGGGGTGTQDLQATYNLSVTPEIVTDSTRGALTIERGSAADTDDIFEGRNGAGTTTFAVTGAGVLSSNMRNVTTEIVGANGVDATLNRWHTLFTVSNITIPLPTAVGNTGARIGFRCLSTAGIGYITIDPNGSQTIDGGLTYRMSNTDTLLVQSDGTNWFIVERKGLVYFYGDSNSGQTVTANTEKLDYEDSNIDDYSTFTGSNTYTVVRNGKYIVNGSMAANGAIDVSAVIYVNGSLYKRGLANGSLASKSFGVTATIDLVVGNTVSIRSLATFTRTTTVTSNILSIMEVA